MKNLLDAPSYIESLELSLGSIVGLSDLKNSKILVTGSTGLICSTIIDQLLYLNRNYKYNIEIYACARNRLSLEKRFGKNLDDIYLKFVSYDATLDIDFDYKVDYIIHGASNASPDLYVEHPTSTMLSNFVGMYNLLNYAKKVQAKRIVYISSSEIYGSTLSAPYLESEYGFVDILNPRSSYASSKRATETLCISFSKEFNIDVMVARPGHIYGPSFKRTDKRVSSMFVLNAIRGEELVLKSAGNQIRSYCYSLDCSSAILSILTRGISREAYNISNSSSIRSIREFSEELSSIAGVGLRFDIQDSVINNPMSDSSLNSFKLEKLGWTGKFSLKEGITNTLKTLNEISF